MSGILSDAPAGATRRTFLTQATAVGALAASGVLGSALSGAAHAAPKRNFKLKFAPHFGQFAALAGDDLVAQLEFMADQGFTALEDNQMMERPVAEQEKIAAALVRLKMTMGVFVVAVGGNENKLFTPGGKDNPRKFAAACEAAVPVAKRVNAKWATVVPGNFTRHLPIGVQTANVIDVLRAGAEVFERHGLVMVLEPLADTPDLFLRTADQAYAICRAVNSASCKILFDMYHLQQNQGQILTSLDQTWSEIAYFQMGDVPGRRWPGTGEMNYGNIFSHIARKMRADGRDFIFGMEHAPWGPPWSEPNKADEQACIDAYVAADSKI